MEHSQVKGIRGLGARQWGLDRGGCLRSGLSRIRVETKYVRTSSVTGVEHRARDGVESSRHTTRDDAPRNWGLIFSVVLCVAFWMIVASTVAHSV